MQGARGKFWVLYNYIRAARRFDCNETITYTTHGDFTFLDNLEPLLERWRGPISVAVYAPGSDLQDTVDVILYFRSSFVFAKKSKLFCNFPHFRDCSPSNLVRDFATFHIIMDLDHIPETVPKQDSLLNKVLVSMI